MCVVKSLEEQLGKTNVERLMLHYPELEGTPVQLNPGAMLRPGALTIEKLKHLLQLLDEKEKKEFKFPDAKTYPYEFLVTYNPEAGTETTWEKAYFQFTNGTEVVRWRLKETRKAFGR